MQCWLARLGWLVTLLILMISFDRRNAGGSVQQFVLSSPAFFDGEDLPRIYTADGSDLSPPLHWDGVPNNTDSFVLFFEDLGLDRDRWVHWLLFDIPADLRRLPAGIHGSPHLANGSRHGLCCGVDECRRLGYQGPSLSTPQLSLSSGHPVSRHRFSFTLVALDHKLSLPEGSSPLCIRQEMKGHQISAASLTCFYGAEVAQMICS